MHDIDKNSDGRLQPTPNADDKVLNRMAHKTIGTTYKSASQPTNQRIIFDQSEIVTYDKDNNVSSFYGYDPDVAANPILKIAKDGYDAKTGTDDQMIFNSQQNTFKITLSSTVSVAVPNPMAAGTIYSTIVPHGLSYTPAYMAFVTTPSTLSSVFSGAGNQIIQTPYNLPVSIGTADRPITAQVWADDTSIHFEVINYQTSGINNVDGNWVFRYYLLQETAI